LLIYLKDAFTLYHKQQEEHPSSALGPALPALGHALAGSTGTAISNLCIYPLDLIVTRLQVQRQLRNSSSTADNGEYEGVFDAAEKIFKNEGGLSAFYAGIVQDTSKSIADSFLFFLFYNYLRQNRLQKHGPSTTSLPVFDELAVGSLAGACSKFFTTPISNIVTRKQTASMISARSSSQRIEPSVNDIVSQIRSEKGIQGFWSGYSASLVLTLNPSITFFLYETFKRTLLPRSRRDDPGARLTFLMAAVSKAIASTITYPFSLAKARAQVGSKPPVNTNAAWEIKSEASAAASKSQDKPLRERQGEVKKAGKDARRTAARSTVFSTILKIYREEGPAALYEGIWGEILKGFFSHGITMLVKEAVHKTIIQLYYMILRALKKFPTPGEAIGQAQNMASSVNTTAHDAVARGGEMASSAYDKASTSVSGAYSTAADKVGDMVDGAKNATNQLGTSKRTVMANRSNVGLGDAYEKAAIMGYNTRANTTKGGTSPEAGSVVGDARKEVGNVGKDVRTGGETGEP
jgi:hypothetical protein